MKLYSHLAYNIVRKLFYSYEVSDTQSDSANGGIVSICPCTARNSICLNTIYWGCLWLLRFRLGCSCQIANGHVSGLYSFIKDMSLAWNDTQPNSSVTLVRLINANMQTSTEKKEQWTLTRNQQGCGLTRRNEVRACNEKRCFRDTKTRQVTENKDRIVFLSYEIQDRKAKKKRPFCFDNIQNN